MADIRQGDDWDGGRGGYAVHHQYGRKMVTRYSHSLTCVDATATQKAVAYLRKIEYVAHADDVLSDARPYFWTEEPLSDEQMAQIAADLRDLASDFDFNDEQFIGQDDWAALASSEKNLTVYSHYLDSRCAMGYTAAKKYLKKRGYIIAKSEFEYSLFWSDHKLSEEEIDTLKSEIGSSKYAKFQWNDEIKISKYEWNSIAGKQ